MGTNSVWLYAFDDENPHKMKLLSVQGTIDKHVRSNLTTIDSKDDKMLQEIFSSEEPVYVKNALLDSRTNKKLVELAGSRTLLNCKMSVDDKVIGAFGTGTHFNEGILDMTEGHISFFHALTKAVAIATNKLTQYRNAHIDPLTKIYNRFGLAAHSDSLLKLAKRTFKKAGVLYIDLDDFKPINDALGHQTGDDVLTSFAKLLVECVRDSDIVARVGGDEFVVVLNCINHSDDINVVLAQIETKAEQLLIGDNETPVCFSIGKAVYPINGENLKTLMHYADSDMYYSKKAKKTRFNSDDNC